MNQLQELIRQLGSGPTSKEVDLKAAWTTIEELDVKSEGDITEEFVKSVIDSLLDREDSYALCIAFRLLYFCPGKCLDVLETFQRRSSMLPAKLLGEVLTSFSHALAQMMRVIYGQIGADWRHLWECLLGFRDQLIQSFKGGSLNHAGVVMRGGRWLQLLVMYLSRRPREGEERDEEEALSLDDLPRDHPLKSSVLREEAIKTIDGIVMALWRIEVATNAKMALVNLLGRIARHRPVFLPKLVPAFIEMYETSTEVYLLSVVEKQLAALVENMAAEKFYPLIVEALKKNTKGRPKKTSASVKKEEEEEEEEEELAKVGTKMIRQDRLVVEIDKLKPIMATDLLIHTLRSVTMEQIKLGLEQWRPTVEIRDPRRPSEIVPEARPVEIKTKGDPGMTVEVKKEEARQDQVVPFDLAPRVIGISDLGRLLIDRFGTVLEGMSDPMLINNPQRQKSRLRSLLRLASLIDEMIDSNQQITESMFMESLLDFVFERPLERLGVLLYRLRLLWLQDRHEAVYRTHYEATMERLQTLISEGDPGWETIAAKFISEAPRLCGTDHVKLINWVCLGAESRPQGLQLLEELIINRPAIRPDLLPLLLDDYCRPEQEDEPLRRAAITMVCDNLLPKVPELEPLILDAAHLGHTKMTDGESEAVTGYNGDLVLRLAFYLPRALEMLLESNELISDEQKLLEQVPSLSTHISLPCLKFVLASSIDEDSAKGHFLMRIVETLCRLKLLTEDLLTKALEAIGEQRWPSRVLEMLVGLPCESEPLKTALVQYILTTDPSEEEHKTNYAHVLAKSAERTGPAILFVFLHQLEGQVPLKRLVEVVFKPDILATALQRLIELAQLPTMLMRTFIQTVSTHRNLTSQVIGLLARLIAADRLFSNPKLWEGFIRCLRAMLPASHALMVQLPVPHLEALLSAAPDLKLGFLSYLNQQPATIKSKYPAELL